MVDLEHPLKDTQPSLCSAMLFPRPLLLLELTGGFRPYCAACAVHLCCLELHWSSVAPTAHLSFVFLKF